MPSRDEIQSDLAAFSDLGTAPIVIEDVTAHVQMEWTYRGATRTATFINPGANCLVEVDGQTPVPYGQFLASPMMADLQQLASRIKLLRSVIRRRSKREITGVGTVYPLDWFIDPKLSSGPGGASLDGTALTRLQEFVEERAIDATRIFFVMAEAGQGKSSVLEAFTARQAERYLRSEATPLALYIDAQGRGLARLDEVIARQLSDLQFLLGYAALVTLVREGLVVLVIDGFDELIGARGTFDDAFRSMSAFIEVLGGRGNVIAASRTTYFLQEYEARGRILSEDLSFDIEQAFVRPWTQTDQDSFVRSALDSIERNDKLKEDVRTAFSSFQADERICQLLGRPLFSRDLLLLLLLGTKQTVELKDGQLVPFLAHEYLRREVEDKLRTQEGPFLTPEQLAEYYRQLAEEMWTLETRELDTRDAEELMELCADASWELTGQAREIARARAAKLPFLVASEDSARRVRFEHEVFFGFFLSGSLHPALDGSGQAMTLLGRGRLDTQTADLVVQTLPTAPQDSLDAIAGLGRRRHPRQEQIQVNAGALAAAAMRCWGHAARKPGLVLKDVTLAGENLSGLELSGWRFSNVTFRRTDLRGAKLRNCSAERVLLEGAFVSPATTRLELDGFDPSSDVNGLQFEDPQTSLLEMTYDPTHVSQLLSEIGLGTDSSPNVRFTVRQPVLDVLGQLCRAFRTANPLGTNHTRWGHLVGAGLGRDVRRVLMKHGLVSQDRNKPTAGPAQEFFRKRFDEAELMGALTNPSGKEPIELAWQELSEL